MRNFYRLTILIAVLALFGAGAVQAGTQAICHFPPGNEANFHTIVVSDDAVANHVALHGDLVGSCLENCEAACDDEDFCTQDVQADLDQCICLAEPRPEVNCDDSNPCTADSCDSDVGACMYDTDILDGTACDDDNPLTNNDVCDGGDCSGTFFCPCWTPAELALIADGQTQTCAFVLNVGHSIIGTDATTGEEEFAESGSDRNDGVCRYLEQSPPTFREVPAGFVSLFCDNQIRDECEARGCLGVICEPLDQCHVAGGCTDGVCDNPNAPDGTTCDDGDAGTTDDVCTGGVCAGTAAASCTASGGTCRTGTACSPGDIEIEGGPWADCPPDEQLCCVRA